MSRWTTIFASIAISSFCLPAIAANNDPPRNVELKPGAASPYAAGQTAADTSSGTTTRQIVTEGKDAPAEAPKEGAAFRGGARSASTCSTSRSSAASRKGRNRASARAGTGTSTASRRGCGSCPTAATSSRPQA